MLKPDISESGPSRTATLIDKIATALDCPVEAFSEHAMADLAETTELLRLWHMLGDERNRLKALSFISALAFKPDAEKSR